METIKAKFCSQCGNSLPPNAAFCPICGQNIVMVGEPAKHIKESRLPESDQQEESNSTNERSIEEDKSAAERPSRTHGAPRLMKTLVYLLWCGVGITVLQLLVGVSDIRECYATGRVGWFIFIGSAVALEAWLAFAVSQRKNWARLSCVVLPIYDYMAGSIASGDFALFSTGEIRVVAFLDNIVTVVQILCVILCLTKPVRVACKTSSDHDSNAKWHCILFWVANVFWWFGIFALGFYRGATGAYVDDMISAAVAGSQEARNQWIGDVRDSYVEDDGLSLSEAEKQATLDVDAAILERRKESGSTQEGDDQTLSSDVLQKLMRPIVICLVFGMPWLIKRIKRKKSLR